MKNIRKNEITTIVFDAFGTLVHCNKKHDVGAYGELLDILSYPSGQEKTMRHEIKQMALTKNMSFDLFVDTIRNKFSQNILYKDQLRIKEILQYELDTILPYTDVQAIIQQIKAMGYKSAVISNLAKPYGDAIRRLLTDFDTIVFSYKVGFSKPKKEIFEYLSKEQNTNLHNMLMIGDHPINDYKMPREYGMQSLLLDRNNIHTGIKEPDSIESLEELGDLLA